TVWEAPFWSASENGLTLLPRPSATAVWMEPAASTTRSAKTQVRNVASRAIHLTPQAAAPPRPPYASEHLTRLLAGARSIQRTPERAKAAHEVVHLIVRVGPARIGQNPGLDPVDGLGLASRARERPIERAPERFDAQYGEHSRAVARELATQLPPPVFELARSQLGGPARGSVDEIRDPAAVSEQLAVLERRQLTVGE